MSKEVGFSYENSLVSGREVDSGLKKIKDFQGVLREESKKMYESEYAALNLVLDHEMHVRVKKMANSIRKAALLVVVGIGGSNLGMQAVEQLVRGKMGNETKDTKIVYADTVDSDEIYEIKFMIEHAVEKGKKVILNCITKSGTTTETIANFLSLLEVMKKERNYRKNVVITTDFHSPLWEKAKSEGYDVLEIPQEVGGRYSVLSPVGLFPLALAGIDIEELVKGARDFRSSALKNYRNSSSLSAIVRHSHVERGQTIQDLFLFGNDFKSLGKWYRQLFAESLGKGCDAEGKKCVGLTPTYSIGTTDMHSIAQLYLGGPFDKLTHFVRLERNRNKLKLPNKSEFSNILPYLSGKRYEEVMKAIYAGVTKSFAMGKRPFCEIILKDKSPYSIGQFLMMQMMEVMYLGRLMGVNVFDQPDIESYKEETRRILSK